VTGVCKLALMRSVCAVHIHVYFVHIHMHEDVETLYVFIIGKCTQVKIVNHQGYNRHRFWVFPQSTNIVCFTAYTALKLYYACTTYVCIYV